MSTPIKQHFLPNVYLSFFTIDKNNSQLQSMIFCGWIDEYQKKRVQLKSINVSFFQKKDFYTTTNGRNPYKYEIFFKDNIEPLYRPIMDEIENEQTLSQECRINLLTWLFFNKYRNLSSRENFERIAKFMFEIQTGNLMHDEIAKQYAKKMQMEFMFKHKMIEEFTKGMGIKKWEILIAESTLKFISSDDPGFSFENYPKQNPETLINLYATKWEAVNFFVLSPKYCLFIFQYDNDVPNDLNFSNQEIKYSVVKDDMIHFINTCTAHTKNKYIISNDKELIERYLKY